MERENIIIVALVVLIIIVAGIVLYMQVALNPRA